MRIGCYPGSFNPPTVAHLAVAEAAVAAGGLDRLDLVLSRSALGKEDLEVPTVDDRAEVLRAVAATRPWLGVVVTDRRLVAEIAQGYDVVVMGADKWRQVIDPSWYGPDTTRPVATGPGATGDAAAPVDAVAARDAAVAARDAAVASLPRVLVAPRAGDRPEEVELLEVDDHHHEVSASAVRSGETRAAGWLLPEAAAFDEATGAWSAPDRYRSSRAGPAG